MLRPNFPVVPIRLLLRGEVYEIEARLDTGFDGDVTVPAHVLGGNGPDRELRLTLADGTTILRSAFFGYVQLLDYPAVPAEIVTVGDEPLIGVGILRRYEVILDHSQRVIINP